MNPNDVAVVKDVGGKACIFIGEIPLTNAAPLPSVMLEGLCVEINAGVAPLKEKYIAAGVEAAGKKAERHLCISGEDGCADQGCNVIIADGISDLSPAKILAEMEGK